MKVTKFITGILTILIIILTIFLHSKENPRVYLNSKNYNIIYASENILIKKLNPIMKIMKNLNFKDEEIEVNILKRIKNIYFLTNTNPKFTENWIGIVDFGYKYPLIFLQINKYFIKEGSLYILKEEYSKKIKIKKIFLKIEQGNFILSNSIENINRFIRKENYLNENMIKVFEREKNKNLGIIMVNLEKNPLSGIDEIVITADMKENGNINIIGTILGDNDMIKGLNQISKDKQYGEKILNKNIMYLRCQNKNVKPILCFINYFLGEGFSDKIFRKMISLKEKKPDKIRVNIDKNQFLYGCLENNKGKIEIEGRAFEKKIKVKSCIESKVLFEIIKEKGRKKKNDKNI